MSKPILVFKLRDDVLDRELIDIRDQVGHIFADYTTAVFRVGDMDVESVSAAPARTFVSMTSQGGDPLWIRDDQIVGVRQTNECTVIAALFQANAPFFVTDSALSVLEQIT